MTKEELEASLQHIYDHQNQCSVTVYVILKNDDSYEPKKLDVDADALPSLKKLFVQSLKNSITDKEDLALLNLSSADERKNAIYLYDLDIPEELDAMGTILANDSLPLFDFSQDQLSRVKAFLVEIGNSEKHIVLYKTMAAINIYSRATNLFLRKDNSRLKEIEDDFLRITSSFQLLKVGDSLFVIDLDAIEKFFGFHEVIKKEAKAGLEAINDMDLIEDITGLTNMADMLAPEFETVA